MSLCFKNEGCKTISINDENLSNLYSDKNINWYNLDENQYVVVLDENQNDVDIFKWQDGKYKTIYKKGIESLAMGKVKAKNYQQKIAIDLLMDKTITVVELSGRFGSGKTFLSTVCSFDQIQNGLYDKIIYIRNEIQVKDSGELGFLKGTYHEKTLPYCMPLADILGGVEALEMYFNQGKIEVESLGFIRGRSFNNSLIIVSEAENLSVHHTQLLLGRVGEGSKIIFDGDVRQVDKKVFSENNGMVACNEKLFGNRLFGFNELQETVRSQTAKLADLLD